MLPEPSTLRIVYHPADVLRKKAEPVGECSGARLAEIRAIAEQMIRLMYEAEGIGLAAPQVGLPIRMFVADVPPPPEPVETDLPIASSGPGVYIDPEFSEADPTFETLEEGCLSLPGINGDVRRPRAITITYTNLEGQRVSESAAGLLARCWQHENDHLDGVLIIDRMTQPSRLRVRSKLKALEKRAAK